MSHLKQTLHNFYTQILETIWNMTPDLKQHFHVAPSYLLVENLGRMLLSLMLLLTITVYLVAVCISNLLWLIVLILKKLAELFKHTVMQALSVQYILCQWADVRKGIISQYKKLQSYAWTKDGDSHPDFTYHYSEMPGELEKNKKFLRGVHTEDQYEKVRKQL